MNHKIIYHTIDENVETYGTFKNVEAQLGDGEFCLCNRCYLVNLRYVIGVNGNDVLIKNGETLVISRHKKKEFLAAVARYYGQGRNG